MPRFCLLPRICVVSYPRVVPLHTLLFHYGVQSLKVIHINVDVPLMAARLSNTHMGPSSHLDEVSAPDGQLCISSGALHGARRPDLPCYDSDLPLLI